MNQQSHYKKLVVLKSRTIQVGTHISTESFQYYCRKHVYFSEVYEYFSEVHLSSFLPF